MNPERPKITRRQFLRITGLAGAGAILAACGYNLPEGSDVTSGPIATEKPTAVPDEFDRLTATLTPRPTEEATLTPLPTSMPEIGFHGGSVELNEEQVEFLEKEALILLPKLSAIARRGVLGGYELPDDASSDERRYSDVGYMVNLVSEYNPTGLDLKVQVDHESDEVAFVPTVVDPESSYNGAVIIPSNNPGIPIIMYPQTEGGAVQKDFENKTFVSVNAEGEVTHRLDLYTSLWVAENVPEEDTPEPIVAPTIEPIVVPTEVAPTPVETVKPVEVEGPKEYVTWSVVDVYAELGGEKMGTVVAGKKFTVLEEQGEWVRISLDGGAEVWTAKSETTYGLLGSTPPGGRTSPEQPGRFAREVVLANGQLVITNMGTRFGVAVSDGGFLDGNGNYCPGGGMPCDGQKGYNTGMSANNRAYVDAMFAKYNTGGKVLKVFFYDDINKFPYADVGGVSDSCYLYGRDTGGAIEYHVGVFDTYNPANNFQSNRISFQINMVAIGSFLLGNYGAITQQSALSVSPQELMALAFPEKIVVIH